jgi:hypothetical protein
MKFYFLIFLGLICGFAGTGRAATNDYFAQGIESSRAGKISKAAAAFQSAVSEQPAAGTLLNLGIAEWQRGHAGAAILAWEQSRWIDPFDARADANLKFARQVTQLEAPNLKWFEKASTWLPPNTWVWLAGISLWVAFGALLLPGIFRWRKAAWQQMLAALALGLFLFCITANLGVVSRTQIGFVLKKNAPLLLTPTETGEVISVLNAGEPARQLRAHGNYLYISTSEGSGWIEQSNFHLICR